MNRNGRRAIGILSLLVGAFLVGVVVTGSLDLTPRTDAVAPGVPAQVSTAANTAGRAVLAQPMITIPSFAEIAARALPSVVAITSTGMVAEAPGRRPFGGGDDLFEFFFGPRQRQGEPRQRRQVSAGSGFFISDDGYVLTNNHVIADANRIEVQLQDRRVLTAKLVGTDPATDVALVKVDSRGRLPALPLGDSEKQRVGDPVVAIGNPLNFAGTVTVGVVSGKGRRGLSDNPNAASLEDFLQTDAAINFGNSGGPLINTAGEVIGINTAMIQPAQNIGFAIPINLAKSIVPQLQKTGHVTRGMLGVRIGPISQDIMQAFRLPSMNGAFVESVDRGDPADRAGVRPGDAIVGVDEVPVREPRDLINYVSSKPPGQKVQLRVVREGRTLTLTATLARREAEEQPAARPAAEQEERHERLGVSVTNLTTNIRRQIDAPADVRGVAVVDVREVSPAGDQGLGPGDIITQVNGNPVSSVDDFEREVNRVGKGEYLRLYVRRFTPQEVSRFVVIRAE
jgi:serine protease Do